jgi:hypothetical protein
LLLVIAALAALLMRQAPAQAPRERPELLLLTSLPIAFPEEFTLDAPKSPVLTALEAHYRVVPIATTDAATLAGRKLLLMIQPQAQTAEALVELDKWVRSGGQVLILADPILEWPTQKPLGDVTRPPLAFPDTGLLAHWGLRLDAPDRLGPETFAVGGKSVHTLSPGTLVATAPGCAVDAKGLIARCRVGKGSATVIADADFADVERRRGPARSANLDVLIAELARLQ